MKIYTSNSLYEFDTVEKKCRRVPIVDVSVLRKDNEWNKYLSFYYEVGRPMMIVLEHLNGDKNGVTFRSTSEVVKVED